MGQWVRYLGGSETKKPKKEIRRRAGDLVGTSCVGGLVGGMPERNWYVLGT